MNQAIQNNLSSDPLSLPSKRKRGRPRKDPSEKRLAITKLPPGFGGAKEKLPQHGNPPNEASDGIVGHTVTGVVDAAFDAGYLLSVRIGNSVCRGIVFKPGHIPPVTVENDVAPHVQVIRRNDIHVPANNRLGNSIVQNGSSSTNQWLTHRTTNMTITTKGKYASPVAPSIFPVGARGTVVPVVLQPASLSNDFTSTPELTPASSQEFGVNDRVYTVEPLAMLPAASSFQTPVSQSQAMPSQIHLNQQGVQEGMLNGNISSARATMTNLQEAKQLQSAETLAQDDPGKELQDSPPPSEIHDHKVSESDMSHGHPSQSVHPSLPGQSISVSHKSNMSHGLPSQSVHPSLSGQSISVSHESNMSHGHPSQSVHPSLPGQPISVSHESNMSHGHPSQSVHPSLPGQSISVSHESNMSHGHPSQNMHPSLSGQSISVSHESKMSHGHPSQNVHPSLPGQSISVSHESNMSFGHPSQTVHPSLPEQSISVSQPLGRYPTGRMTDLLLAFQGNMMENQVHHAESDSPSSTSTDDHDEESGD